MISVDSWASPLNLITVTILHPLSLKNPRSIKCYCQYFMVNLMSICCFQTNSVQVFCPTYFIKKMRQIKMFYEFVHRLDVPAILYISFLSVTNFTKMWKKLASTFFHLPQSYFAVEKVSFSKQYWIEYQLQIRSSQKLPAILLIR